ncbi:MAG: hypothetical protein WCG26_08665 [Chloroflexales bacterium]
MVMLIAALVACMPHRAAAQGTPTPTARADERPDACEPNDTPAQACRLTLDAVSGPFTFLPEGDQDYYSIFLGAQPDGLIPTITVRATSGLDVLTTVTRADTGGRLATIASPAISLALAADVTGWVILRVENRAGAIASGQSYRIEVRKALPPAAATTATPGPEGLTRPVLAPDVLENNYSPETAAPIGVGILYDLNFVCPVPDGCAGGDHDYLRFDAKAGMRYLISTLDLASGVDTALDLFWHDPAHGWVLLASNDDARPGAAFLSTLRWQAPPTDGAAILRVAPRTGGLNPVLVGSVPTYRVAVALAGSALAAQLEERIAIQTGMSSPVLAATPDAAATSPTGAATPPPAAPPALPTPMPITTSGPPGATVYLIADAAIYVAPDPASAVLAQMPVDSLLTATGSVSGLYAEVTSSTVVGAGWVSRRALRPSLTAAGMGVPGAPAGVPGPSGSVPGVPAGTPGPAGAGSTTGPTLRVRALDPLPPAPAPISDPAISLGLTVTVQTAGGQPVAGVRLVLTTLFGDRYVENLTGPTGTATLTTVVPVGEALVLQVPDMGLQQRISGTQTSLTLVVPEGTQ